MSRKPIRDRTHRRGYTCCGERMRLDARIAVNGNKSCSVLSCRACLSVRLHFFHGMTTDDLRGAMWHIDLAQKHCRDRWTDGMRAANTHGRNCPGRHNGECICGIAKCEPIAWTDWRHLGKAEVRVELGEIIEARQGRRRWKHEVTRTGSFLWAHDMRVV